MSGWKAKRFWSGVEVVPVAGGFGVSLDGRPLRTPAKATLVLPSHAMAQVVAEEWGAVEGDVQPLKMPVTRRANAAIDKVTPQFNEVAALIADYGGTDLLCYRAEAPEELATAQAEAWDPMLDWAADTLGARLRTQRGITPVEQPFASLACLGRIVRATTPFELTALHDLVGLTGSLVLGLAASRAEFEPEDLWRLSRFDENWQAALWGVDEEAAAAAEAKRVDFLHARNFWMLSQPAAK